MAFETVKISSTRNGITAIQGYREDLAISDAIVCTLSDQTGVSTYQWQLVGRPEGSSAGGAGPEPINLGTAASCSFTVDTDASYRKDGTYVLQCTVNAGAPTETHIRTILCRLAGVSVAGGRTLRKLGGFESLDDTSIPSIIEGWATQLNRWLEAVRSLVAGGGGGGGQAFVNGSIPFGNGTGLTEDNSKFFFADGTAVSPYTANMRTMGIGSNLPFQSSQYSLPANMQAGLELYSNGSAAQSILNLQSDAASGTGPGTSELWFSAGTKNGASEWRPALLTVGDGGAAGRDGHFQVYTNGAGSGQRFGRVLSADIYQGGAAFPLGLAVGSGTHGGVNGLFDPGAGGPYIGWLDGTSVAVAPANQGRIRYNNTSHVFEWSANTSAWLAFGSGGGGGAPIGATYITQTADGTLTNEQALSLNATGLMKSTTTTGVVSTAVINVDYQGVLGPADPTIVFPTAQTVKVGVIPDAVIAQGTSATHMTGAQFLGALSTGLLKNTTATGVLSIAAAGVDYQQVLTFSQGVTLSGSAVTGDYITGKVGNQVWVGGTAATNTLQIKASSNAAPGALTLTAGQLVADIQPGTIPSGAGATFDGLRLPGATVTLSGATTVATALGFNYMFVAAPTYNGSATITNAATLAIASSPTGSATVTNAYALWVQAGQTYLAGIVKIQALNGLLKAAGGIVGVGTSGTDYELPLSFTSGLTRVSNTVTGDYITGRAIGGGGQTTWTGGTGSGEGIILSTTSHGTKGRLTVGTMIYDEQNNRLGVGQPAPLKPVHIDNAGDVQLRLGQSSGSEYDLGRNGSVDGLFYINSTHATVSGLVVTGVNGDRFKVASDGSTTILGLAGSGSALVKTSAVGLLSRGVAGTDYEPGLTFASGLTRAVNTVTGDYITGRSGGQTWTFGTGAGDNGTIQTFATSPTGTLSLLAGALSLQAAHTTWTVSQTVAQATSATLDALSIATPTITVSGTGGITTASGFNLVRLPAPTYTSGSAVTITNAATLALIGPPAQAGSLTITNPYVLWAQAGAVRLDGANASLQAILLGSGAEQDIIKQGGTLGIGTSDANSLTLRTNGAVRQQINSSGQAAWSNSGSLSVGAANGVVWRFNAGVTTATSATLDTFLWDNSTATFTGSGSITTAAGVNQFVFNQPTYTSASAVTITNAATVSIQGAPTQAGSLGITNGYALWVQAGQTKLAGTLAVTGASNLAGAVTIQALNGLLKATSGLVSVGVAGTDYEPGLTFSTGLTRAVNTITSDLSTGKGAGQTVYGGTSGSGSLTLRSTNNIALGLIHFGSSTYDDSSNDVLSLLSGNTTFSTPTLILASSGVSGQAVMHFRTGTSTLRAGLRGDSVGNLVHFSTGGYQHFLTGGDFGTGSVRAKIFNNGNFQIAGVGAGTDPSDVGAMFGVAGTSAQATIASWGADPAAMATSAGLTWFGHVWHLPTVTLTGSTNVTSGLGLNHITFSNPQIGNSSAMTVTNAATVAITGSPTVSGLVSITNNYALRVFQGVTRMDDGLTIGAGVLTSSLMLSMTGKAGADSVLIATGGGTYSDSLGHALFRIQPFGQAVADAVASPNWYGLEVRPVTYTRAGVGTPPSVANASTVRITGEPAFSGIFSIPSRYALHVSSGVARFDAGGAVNPSVVLEVPQHLGGTGTDSGYNIPVFITGVGIKYIQLNDIFS